MRKSRIKVRLNRHSIVFQRLRHDLPIIPERIKFTRTNIRRREILQVRRIQRREVGAILGVNTRILVELQHGSLVDDGHVLRVLGVRLVVGLVLLGDVVWVDGQRHDGHDAADVLALFRVADHAVGDGEREPAASTAADGEEFAGVAAVGGGVLLGLSVLLASI